MRRINHKLDTAIDAFSVGFFVQHNSRGLQRNADDPGLFDTSLSATRIETAEVMALSVDPEPFGTSPSATRIELAEVMALRVDPEPLDTSPSATN